MQEASAASPHYIREYISEGAGADTDSVNFRAKEGRERDRSFNPDDREIREMEASEAFRRLQEVLPIQYRSVAEDLCVENRHVGLHALPAIRIAFATVRDHFKDEEKGGGRKKRPRKRRQPVETGTPIIVKKATENRDEVAWMEIQRIMRPDLGADRLEEAWALFNALKASADFRREKLADPT